MPPHPATPPVTRDRERASLWPSPQFSDYFSDAGDSASYASDQRKANTPVQARIIDRLGVIARKVSEQEHDGSQRPHLHDFDTELSALESRLNAPESQTREIAEETGSLFLDDDDPTVLQAENNDLRRELQEGRDVLARVSRLRESLQHHYDEMKSNYQLAIKRLEAASDEISALKEDYANVKAENDKLHDHNSHLHNDLQTAIPTISRLKSRLENIEHRSLEHLGPEAYSRLEESISSLTREFEDVDRDFDDIARRYRKPSSRVDSAIGNSTPQPSSRRDARSASPETAHRSIIIIRRGGLIRRIDADASSTSSSEGSDEAVHVQEQQQVEPSHEAADDFHDVESDEDIQTHSEDEIEEKEMKETLATKTPWQELWDSIAEFAGMHNYDDE